MDKETPLVLTFDQAIDQAVASTEDIGLLPICHNTLEAAFYDIQLDRIIIPQETEKPDEKLSFFFYGKPSYISKHKKLDEMTDDLPITMIFDLSSIENDTYRLMPFDSGGFGRYKMKHGFKVEHFVLQQPCREKLRKLVKSFFSTNKNYLDKELSINIPNSIINKCRALKSYVDMIKNAVKTGGAFGEQAFTFELQFKEEAPFNPTAIILHQSYVAVEDWDKEVEKYAKYGIDLYGYGKAHQSAMELRVAYEEIDKKVYEIVSKMV